MWLDYTPKIWHSVHIFQRIKIFHDGVGLLGLKYYLFRNVRLFQIKSAREQSGIVLIVAGHLAHTLSLWGFQILWFKVESFRRRVFLIPTPPRPHVCFHCLCQIQQVKDIYPFGKQCDGGSRERIKQQCERSLCMFTVMHSICQHGS